MTSSKSETNIKNKGEQEQQQKSEKQIKLNETEKKKHWNFGWGERSFLGLSGKIKQMRIVNHTKEWIRSLILKFIVKL